ncbi:MAG: GNAT family N-acetyltransferase [Sedimenticola sp.]|nr:GNAT family N-acetyltransferase [Sedimenticola sp.]
MITIQPVDLERAEHATALVALLDAYARDPMGGGKGLPETTRNGLVAALRQRRDLVAVLAFDRERPVGLVNCFEGFSTFRCQPLLNIHDVVVVPEYRRQGVARKMLLEVERIARERGCCKLTLEVLEGNKPAREAYRDLGFSGYELDPVMGRALFWEKPLPDPDYPSDSATVRKTVFEPG